MAMDTTQVSQQALEILRRAKKENEERDKKNAIPGLPQPEPVRLPNAPESTEEIPSMVAGDPANTAMLDQQYKRLNSEIEALQSQPQKGILESLRGPRKWMVAMQLALNPGMRGQINRKLQSVRDERIQKRRDLMLRIGIELGNRSVDPVQKAYYEKIAKGLADRENADLEQDRLRRLADDAVRRGVIDDYDRQQVDRMGLGLSERSRAEPGIQLQRGVNIINSAHTAVKGMSKENVSAYSEVLKSMGLPVNDVFAESLQLTAAANPKDKPPSDETPAQKTARMNREARQVWSDNLKLVEEASKKMVWVNEDEMRAIDPDAQPDDDGAIKRYISTWSPEEKKAAALKLSERSELPPELFRKFWTEPDGGGGDDDDPEGDAQDAKEFEEWWNSQPPTQE